MSGKDAGATMHFHASAYNILFFGWKKWILLPPRYTEISGMPVSKYIRDTETRGIHKYECMQRPGDLVLLPRYWGHATINPYGFATGLGNLYLDAKTEATLVAHHQVRSNIPEGVDEPDWVLRKDFAEPPLKTKPGGKMSKMSGFHDVHANDFDQAMRPPVGRLDKETMPKYNPDLKFPVAAVAVQNSNELSNDRGAVCSRPIAFVHINKAGGTAMLEDLQNCCSSRLLSAKEKGKGKKQRKGASRKPSNFFFHASADRQRQLVGEDAWNNAFKFALVRNPWARQVSMFHFLVGGHCKTQLVPATDNIAAPNDEPHYMLAGKPKGGKACSTRLLPSGQGDWLDDNANAIPAFRKWMKRLDDAFPTGHPDNYLFGSMAHGNDESPWFNASQLSWMVDRSGQVLVDKVIKLEELTDQWSQLTTDLCAPATLEKSHVSDTLFPSILSCSVACVAVQS
jgi:hypothetical protein